MRALPVKIHAANPMHGATTRSNEGKRSMLGMAITMTARPRRPPRMAPAIRRSDFFVLAPRLDCATTMHVMSAVDKPGDAARLRVREREGGGEERGAGRGVEWRAKRRNRAHEMGAIEEAGGFRERREGPLHLNEGGKQRRAD